MKNYVKDSQKLPMFGVGPYLVGSLGVLTLAGMLLSGNILKSGMLGGLWVIIFRVIGTLILSSGLAIWFIGAMKSDMDDSIIENRLQTGGIYAWVRNPMYSGVWYTIIGIGLMCHNWWLIVIQIINWGIMTIVLKNTEEKWLENLYGEEYMEYKSQVNRCIMWFPRKK